MYNPAWQIPVALISYGSRRNAFNLTVVIVGSLWQWPVLTYNNGVCYNPPGIGEFGEK